MEGNAKLRLLNCTGYALRQGDDLQKIQTEIMEVTFIAPVAFILDDGGDIKCTVIKDKAKFEDETNIDRRVSNVNNSFNVLWDQDGRTCTIYRNVPGAPKSGMGEFPWIPAIISAVVGIGVGLLIGWISWGDSGSKPVVYPEPDYVVVRESVDTVAVEPVTVQESQIEEAKDYVRKLQSLECTMSTVDEVEKWWSNLSDNQRSELSEYKIPERLRAYKKFFTASHFADMKDLYRFGRKIFSSYQWRIIEGYGRDRRDFYELYERYGMTFRIPESVISRNGKRYDEQEVEMAAPADSAK